MSLTLTKETDFNLDEAVRHYRETGYVVLRNVFTPEEAAAFGAECDRLASDKNLTIPGNVRTPFRAGAVKNPERIDPVVDVSEVFAKLAADPRMTLPVTKIFGIAPHLFKAKIVYKDPGVHGYPLHQDGSWWQGLGMPMNALLSVMVAIDGAGKDNGCLEVFPGHHDRLRSTPGQNRNMNADEAKGIDVGHPVYVETNPGDVTIFHALTPHKSGINTSTRGRRQFYLTYSSGEYPNGYESHCDYYIGSQFRQAPVAERRSKFFV